MKLDKLFSAALVTLTALSLSTPAFAQTAAVMPGQAKAQVQAQGLQTQAVLHNGQEIVGTLFACDPDNDHGATAQFVVDGHALVPNLNVMEAEGWNEVQAGIDLAFPAGGIADAPAGTNVVWVWKPLGGTVSGCNQGLYLFDRNINPFGGTQTELYPPIFTTTGPDANGYFTSTALFNPGFTILEMGLIATDNGKFNVRSFSFGGNEAVFPLPGGNHRRPTLNTACPFGTNHAAITFDFYCGQ